MVIKILGPGCQKCQTLYKLVNEVLQELNFKAIVEKVENIDQITAYGIVATPALVINEKIVFNGRVPAKPDIKKLIEQYI